MSSQEDNGHATHLESRLIQNGNGNEVLHQNQQEACVSRQTDGRTDRKALAIPCIALHGVAR